MRSDSIPSQWEALDRLVSSGLPGQVIRGCGTRTPHSHFIRIDYRKAELLACTRLLFGDLEAVLDRWTLKVEIRVTPPVSRRDPGDIADDLIRFYKRG